MGHNFAFNMIKGTMHPWYTIRASGASVIGRISIGTFLLQVSRVACLRIQVQLTTSKLGLAFLYTKLDSLLYSLYLLRFISEIAFRVLPEVGRI